MDYKGVFGIVMEYGGALGVARAGVDMIINGIH
jgi:hypothetical protein